MKNRNEQPSAKQRAEKTMQNRNEQNMKNKMENRMDSCNKDREARVENSTKNSVKEQ